MSTRLDYALAFAKQGFFVHPCSENKVPLTKAWVEGATTDAAQIMSWAEKFPNCRWGISTGKCGLFVLDVDVQDKQGRKGADSLSLLEADNGPLPHTFTVKTRSGGKHYYFAGQGKTDARHIAPALDTRGQGGNLIIPDGIDYTVINNAPIAPAPAWLIEKAGHANTKERHENADQPAPGVTLDSEHNILQATIHALKHAPGCEEGARDKTAVKVALQLRDFGLTEPTVYKILSEVWAERKDVEIIDFKNLEEKVYSAFKSAKSQLGSATAEAAFAGIPAAEPPRPVLMAATGQDLDLANIPKRRWLLGRWFIKGFISVTISPGGAGKSMLTMLEAAAIATGKHLTGDHVHEHGAVWIYNTEDPLDELRRRYAALCIQHKIDWKKAPVYLTSGRDNPLLLAWDSGRQVVVNEPLIAEIIKFINENQIKLWVIDPFVKCHAVDENGNMGIDKVMTTLGRIAESTDCSISIVHHTGKGRDEALGNMDKSRGASSFVSAARVVRTLYSMDEKEAKKFSLEKPRSWYVRLDDAKANMMPPAEGTTWFEKMNVELPSGDNVGTVKLIKLEAEGETAFEDELANAIIEEAMDGDEITVPEAIDYLVSAGKRFGSMKEGAARHWLTKKIFLHAREREGMYYKLEKPRPGGRKVAAIVKTTIA